MTDTMTDVVDLGADRGSWRRTEDGWELRFERRLRHSPETVWEALASPEGLACWLARAVIEPRPGGRMDLAFQHPPCEDFPDPETHRQSNQVITWDPPRVFEHTFDEGTVVRWTLVPEGSGTLLSLTHRIRADRTALHQTLSGWHHHLEGLEGAVSGTNHAWSWNRWRALDRAYAERIGCEPAAK